MKRCNVCGATEFRTFMGEPDTLCTSCYALPRTRMLWAFIDRDVSLDETSRVMHVAPELGLYRTLRERVGKDRYHLDDIATERHGFAENHIRRLDLCTDTRRMPDESFALILHGHALEHVPSSLACVLHELHRLPRPGGRHAFVVPFLPGPRDECFGALPEAEAKRRFGSTTHVRRFGLDGLDRSIGCMIRLPEVHDAEAEFGSACLEEIAVPRRFWKGLDPGTVLMLGKSDMLL